MAFSLKYINDSLYYYPWKTKFIERFCIMYAHLKCKMNISPYDEITDDAAELFKELFIVMMNILKRILKSHYNKDCIFYDDIIKEAHNQNLIFDIKTYYDILDFLAQYIQENTYKRNFKFDYLNIPEEFSKKFKQLVRTLYDRDKDYVFYDNSEFLWGINKYYYNILTDSFLEFPKLKIVRIFGSRVTDNFHKFSDIDIICEGTYSPKEYLDLFEQVQNLDLPYIIDMFDIKIASRPFVYRNVIRSNIFYERRRYVEDNYETILK